MRMAAAFVATLLVLATGAAAHGDELATGESGFSHKKQFGAFVQGGIGYRGIFTFNEEYCGELKDGGGNKSNCLGRSPFAVDIGGSYGVTHGLELILDVTLGLESDFGSSPSQTGPHILAFAPGLKLFLTEIGATEFFATIELPVDVSSYEQSDKADIGVRNRNGLILDIGRQFGAYFYFGEAVSWRRWLRFEVDAGLGVQLRL
jgi:hypothetical protein